MFQRPARYGREALLSFTIFIEKSRFKRFLKTDHKDLP